MTAQYVIVSQDGMPPFATANNKQEALKLSRRAKMLGFTGRIVKYDLPPPEADQTPAVVTQINGHTFRISKYKPNGYAIHRQRANGSWKRWARLESLNDRADAEAAIELVRACLPATA